MKADTDQALMMLSAFESVGVHSFDVTMTNIEGEKTLVFERTGRAVI